MLNLEEPMEEWSQTTHMIRHSIHYNGIKDMGDATWILCEQLYDSANAIDEVAIEAAMLWLCDHSGIDDEYLQLGLNVKHYKFYQKSQ